MSPILWYSAALNSTEYFTLTDGKDEHTLAGTILARIDGEATHIAYQIVCDRAWHTRRVRLSQKWAGETRTLEIEVDAAQTWIGNATPLPTLRGLIDVDLAATPATNLLPVRRYKLAVGSSVETVAAWIQFPSLSIEKLPQRYTRLDQYTYLYEAPTHSFRAEITVDEDGLVVNYGDVWRRV